MAPPPLSFPGALRMSKCMLKSSGRPCPVASPVLKPVRRQLRVAHGVLDVAVAQVGLQRARIVPLVGQGEAVASTFGNSGRCLT
jgi:hypothetical protein